MDFAVKHGTELIKLLERLGSFALVSFILVFNFTQTNQQLKLMASTQERTVEALQVLTTEMQRMTTRLDYLERSGAK